MKSYSWNNESNRDRQKEAWFKHWVRKGFSVAELANQSRHGRTQLYEIINEHLRKNPVSKNKDLSKYKHLIMDATYLDHRNGIIAIMDAETNKIVQGQYGVKESSIPQLMGFLHLLKRQGLEPKSFTVDGNKPTIYVLKQLWPNVVIQRCLVHMQRQGLSWCRANPKRTDAKKLRNIFLPIPRVKSFSDRDSFLKTLQEWELRYGSKIDSKPERGPVFSDLKRARSSLLKATPSLFHYLDDPLIPSSTNALEGYFSRLKARYRSHRGLVHSKRSNYFSWYFFLCPI